MAVLTNPFPAPSIDNGGRPLELAVTGAKNSTASVSSTIKVTEYGGTGAVRITEIELVDTPVAITDANAYGSVLLYTMPQGKINVLGGSVQQLTETTTSAIASTLNSGATLGFGIGSAAASNITLSSTMLSFAPGTGQSVPTVTSSTVIDTPSTSVGSSALAAALILDGSTTAVPVYLNVSVPTNTEIDADATTTWTGKIFIIWIYIGDAS